MSDVILTKLMPPTFNTAYLINRSRLLNPGSQLEEKRLILITAPAGYGKTVLLLQLATIIRKPVVWYQLDGYDNDPAVVIKYLLTGILQHLPKVDHKIKQLLTKCDTTINPRLAIIAMVNSLTRDASGGMILVLDDYHLITEPAVHRFFEELLHYLPGGVQLIIASRLPIPLTLVQLDPNGTIQKIDAADLRFTRQEINEYLAQRGIETTEAMVDTLEEKTAGWPVALHFFQGSPIDGVESPRLAERMGIFDYLVSEVLNAQPGEIQEFLLATAVLNLLTPVACDQLLNRNDSTKILDRLAKEQTFLTPLECTEKTYLYHQLFREFLLERLGEERKTLFRRAGDLAWQRGESTNAIEYYQAAGSRPEVIKLIKESGLQVLQNGRWQTVLHWMEFMTRDDLRNDSWLAFFQATIEVYQGRTDEAERWLEESVPGFTIRQDRLGLIESAILRARILSAHGRYQASLAQLEKVTAELTPEEINGRFYLILEKTYCLVKLGRFCEAESILTKALELVKNFNNDYIMTYFLEGLASIYYLQGEYPKSLQTYRKALAISPDKSLPGYYIQDSIVGIYGDWGEADKAFEIAQRNVAVKERLGMFETLPSAYMFLGVVYILRAEYQTAESVCRQGISLVEENMGDYYMDILLRNFLAWSVCAQGRRVEAKAQMEENLRMAREIGGLILPCSLMMNGMVLALAGDYKQAIRDLLQAAEGLEEIGCRIPLCCSYKVLSWSYFNEGKVEKANNYAKKFLQLAAKINLLDGYLNMTYEMMYPIFRYGLENGIEVTYIQRILVRLGERAFTFLQELARSKQHEVRQRAIIPLAEIEGRTVKDVALFINDQNPAIQRTVSVSAQKSGVTESDNTATSVILVVKNLGPLRVFWGNREITAKLWPTVKTRDLLAYFAHHRGPVTTERILEDLWPELERGKALSNFHITLHRLRQTLFQISQKNLIVYGAKHYQLLPGELIIDHLRFEELVSTGLAGLNRIEQCTPADSVACLKEALTIYRGDYLSELDYTWIVSCQEHLKQLHYEAKLQLARYFLNQNEYHQAIIQLEPLVKINPFIEEVHCMLMTAYSGLGNRQAVQKQYQTLMTTLDEELCLAPSPETTELYFKLGGPH